jgi:hypothetical protein
MSAFLLRPLACLRCGFESRRGAKMFVSCNCCVFSGRGLCDGPIPRPEASYRLRVSFSVFKYKDHVLHLHGVGRRYQTKNKVYYTWSCEPSNISKRRIHKSYAPRTKKYTLETFPVIAIKCHRILTTVRHTWYYSLYGFCPSSRLEKNTKKQRTEDRIGFHPQGET